MLNESGYLDALQAERTIEAEGRVENLEELVGVAGEFDANRELEGESDVRPLEEFLAQISLYTDQDALRTEESLCTLMTLHNAKGLEYEAVFMIGCEEGVFPHMRSLEEGNLEEERRLCYVGVTRAKQRLCMTFARRRSLHGGARAQPALAVPRRDPGRAGRAPGSGIADRLGGGRPARARDRARRAERPPPHASPLEFQVGDDVVHATFGEGVVTAVEPGGVIVVRFAADGHRAQADGRLRAAEEGLRPWQLRSAGSSARVIDGKAVAAEVRERGRAPRCRSSRPRTAGRAPGLATVLVGDDPASHVYVANKRKQTEEVGMRSIHHGLDASAVPGGAARAGRRAERRRRRWTGSWSSSRCPARSTRTR